GMGGMAGTVAAQEPQPKPVAPPKELPLPPFDAPTEQKQGLAPAPWPPEGRVGYALVGLGRLTIEQLMPAFAQCERAKPTALVTGDRAKGLELARQYGISERSVLTYAEYDRLRDLNDVQAVYVVLPNGMHEEYATRAVGLGKHVLCEKPMANDSAQAQRMVEAAKRANRKLMIAYRIQYEPLNALAKEWTRTQKWGKPKLLDLVNVQNQGEPDQWRHKKALAGGGSLPDIGLYCLNTARYLLGEEPIEVLATIYSTPGDPRFREVEENCLWQMRFPSGTQANCLTGYGTHNSKRYRVYAERAWYGLDPAFSYNGLQMEGSYAEDDTEYGLRPKKGQKNQFALEMDHFARCIMEGKRPYTPGEEGVQDHRIMEAIYESARTGKVVKLPEVKALDAFRGEPPRKR
ncbi:Gfo/Idh/MocA family oxidoreductase, partial [bacterium]